MPTMTFAIRFVHEHKANEWRDRFAEMGAQVTPERNPTTLWVTLSPSDVAELLEQIEGFQFAVPARE